MICSSRVMRPPELLNAIYHWPENILGELNSGAAD